MSAFSIETALCRRLIRVIRHFTGDLDPRYRLDTVTEKKPPFYSNKPIAVLLTLGLCLVMLAVGVAIWDYLPRALRGVWIVIFVGIELGVALACYRFLVRRGQQVT
jgi:hypothetical protein